LSVKGRTRLFTGIPVLASLAIYDSFHWLITITAYVQIFIEFPW